MSRSPVRAARLAGKPLELPTRPAAELVAPPRPDSREGILDEARREVADMAEAAAAEAAALRQAAIDDGRDEGFRQATEHIRSTMLAAEAVLAELEEEKRRRPDDAADEVAAVAIEVAARIVRAEVAARPERVLDVVRGAIRRASERDRLLARVHPDDLARCREAAPDLLTAMGGVDRLVFVEEPRAQPGSCVLETPAGDIDATFATQLERLLAALADAPDADLVKRGA